jgi:hypothetical protein
MSSQMACGRPGPTAGRNARLGAVYSAHAGRSHLRRARVHRGASRASVRRSPACTARGRRERHDTSERAGAVRHFNLFVTFRLKRTRDFPQKPKL